MIQREEFLTWFREWLALATEKQVGLSDVPSVNPDIPYCIVDLMPSPDPQGSLADPEEDITFTLQIKSVGDNPRSAMWMSDKIREAVVGRDDDGNLMYQMQPDAFTVSKRLSSGLGSIVKSGERLFEIPDVYRIEVVK